MTEAQIRARTRSALYAGATVLMFASALLNYRYGLFDLFYTATLFIPLMAFGAIFSLIQLKYQLKETGHEIILTVAVVLVALRLNQGIVESQHWLYPLGLMSFLVLSIKSASLFNVITLVFVSILIFIVEDSYSGMRFFASYFLLTSVAGMFAYLHHHKTQSLVELTITDAMTGLYNMKYLDDMLTKEVSRVKTTGYPLSLIALRIDYLEDTRTLHGQLACNELLTELAVLLKTMIRAGDSPYYSGQESFYLMLPFTPAEGVLVIAERIRREVEQASWPNVDKMTVCLGSVTHQSGEESASSLLRKVDDACQEAQRRGHNRVSHCNA